MDDEADDLTLNITLDNDTAVIAIAGDIDVATRDLLTRSAHDAVDANVRTLILDMSGVSFMDSSGIGALIALQTIAEVILRKPSIAVERLLDVTGLAGTFEVEP
jgi:anti-sigma B factor antagonist